MTTATATTLGDIPRESIAKITWVGFSGRLYYVAPAEFRGFIWRFKNTPVQMLDGHWHSTESAFPYRSFSVFLK